MILKVKVRKARQVHSFLVMVHPFYESGEMKFGK